jgi:hypothetical protein
MTPAVTWRAHPLAQAAGRPVGGNFFRAGAVVIRAAVLRPIRAAQRETKCAGQKSRQDDIFHFDTHNLI